MTNNLPLYTLRSSHDTGHRQMAIDMLLLNKVASLNLPIFRHYSFSDSAVSFGYTQSYQSVKNSLEEDRVLVRRPTGGGIVDHKTDWTYSLIVPPSFSLYQMKAADSYEWIHSEIAAVLSNLGQNSSLQSCRKGDSPDRSCTYQPKKVSSCAIEPVTSDIMSRDEKIAGAAQKRTKAGLLIQGSIFLSPLEIEITTHFEDALARRLMHSLLCDTLKTINSPITEIEINSLSSQYLDSSWLRKR